MALVDGRLFRLIDPSSGEVMIQALTGAPPLSRGLAIGPDTLLLSSLFGSVFEVFNGRSEPFLAPAGEVLELGWASAIHGIGSASLLIQDTGQSQLSLWVPGEDLSTRSGQSLASPMLFPLHRTPGQPLRDWDSRFAIPGIVTLQATLLGRRSPLPVAPGQNSEDTLLPMIGELRVMPWVGLLDNCLGLLLWFDPVNGVEHLAGSEQRCASKFGQRCTNRFAG